MCAHKCATRRRRLAGAASLFTRDSSGDFVWESTGESAPEVAGIRITHDETDRRPSLPPGHVPLTGPPAGRPPQDHAGTTRFGSTAPRVQSDRVVSRSTVAAQRGSARTPPHRARPLDECSRTPPPVAPAANSDRTQSPSPPAPLPGRLRTGPAARWSSGPRRRSAPGPLVSAVKPWLRARRYRRLSAARHRVRPARRGAPPPCPGPASPCSRTTRGPRSLINLDLPAGIDKPSMEQRRRHYAAVLCTRRASTWLGSGRPAG